MHSQGIFLKICKETNEEEASAYEHFFSFITSFLITTGIGIIFLLFHCQAVRREQKIKKKKKRFVGKFFFSKLLVV